MMCPYHSREMYEVVRETYNCGECGLVTQAEIHAYAVGYNEAINHMSGRLPARKKVPPKEVKR